MKRRQVRGIAAGLAIAAISLSFAAGAQRNSGTEYRSLNTDLYHIEIQKNGQVDVLLGGIQPAIFDAFPMVWFADEDEPRRLKTDGRWTQRYSVEDRLGDGHGMLQRYKSVEWTVRAYPTRPYFAVQVAYINTGKKPVTLRALMPWCVGDPDEGAVTLGAGTEDSAILTGFTHGRPEVLGTEGESPDAIAIANPKTGRSLIAGFITQNRASNRIEIGEPKGDEDSAFYRFRAICEFDPPITLQPDEQIHSEVLYLAVAEQDPVIGVQRYARAVSVANKEHDGAGPFRAWTLPNATPVKVAALLAEATRLAPTSEIPHAIIGYTPGAAAVAFTADEFESMSALAETIQRSGLRPVLWCDPTAFRADDPRVEQHPDWFTGGDSDSIRVLDLGRPEAAGILGETGSQLAAAGIDTIAGIDVSRLERAKFSTGGTPTDAIRGAIGALRAAMGGSARVYASSASLLATILTDGVISATGSPAESVRASSLSPSSFRLSGYSGVAAANTQAAASLTDAALLVDAESALLWPEPRMQLSRLFPPAERFGVPTDLFDASRPRVLHSRHENAAGVAHTVAVFNWNPGGPETTSLPLSRLGMERNSFHTVYDFWNGRYLGTATERLHVNVAAGDVSLLVLRPYVERPAPLMIGTNLGQSSPRWESVEWDPRSNRLSVSTRDSGRYSLPFVLPQDLVYSNAESVQGSAEAVPDPASPRYLRVDVEPNTDGRAEFTLDFTRTR